MLDGSEIRFKAVGLTVVTAHSASSLITCTGSVQTSMTVSFVLILVQLKYLLTMVVCMCLMCVLSWDLTSSLMSIMGVSSCMCWCKCSCCIVLCIIFSLLMTVGDASGVCYDFVCNEYRFLLFSSCGRGECSKYLYYFIVVLY